MTHGAQPALPLQTHVHHAGATLIMTALETLVNAMTTVTVTHSGQTCASITVQVDGTAIPMEITASVLQVLTTKCPSTLFLQDGPQATPQPSIAAVEPTSVVMETTSVGTTGMHLMLTTLESGSALRPLDMSSTTTTKLDHTTMTVIIVMTGMITIPLKPNVVNSHSTLMNVMKPNLQKDFTDGG